MSAEQQARDMLWRLGVEDAQSYTAGDLVELANLISERDTLTEACKSIGVALMDHGKILRAMEAERDALAAEHKELKTSAVEIAVEVAKLQAENALLKRSLALLVRQGEQE